MTYYRVDKNTVLEIRPEWQYISMLYVSKDFVTLLIHDTIQDDLNTPLSLELQRDEDYPQELKDFILSE